MSLETVGLAVLGIALAYALGGLAKRCSRRSAIPIEVVVGDEWTEVTVDGRRLLTELSLIRYTTNHAFGLPRLLNFVANPDGAGEGKQAKEYRIGAPGEQPATGIVHAFIAGCCLRAREELGVSQMRPLRVSLVLSIRDPNAKSTVSREIHPDRFGAIGVQLKIAETATHATNRTSSLQS